MVRWSRRGISGSGVTKKAPCIRHRQEGLGTGGGTERAVSEDESEPDAERNFSHVRLGNN